MLIIPDKPKNSKKTFIHARDESPKMFENEWLDKLTRVHWTVPLLLFVPVIIYMLYKAIFLFQLSALTIIGYMLIGLFIWSFVEYFMHRFIFHYEPKNKIGQKLHFLFHGVHHDYPSDSKRLVLVPSMSIPLATGFYLLYFYIAGEVLTAPLFAGFIIGYLAYDMIHYALHHVQFDNAIWQKLKDHHMVHHFSEPDNGFGVSNNLWDVIFGTMFKKK